MLSNFVDLISAVTVRLRGKCQCECGDEVVCVTLVSVGSCVATVLDILECRFFGQNMDLQHESHN